MSSSNLQRVFSDEITSIQKGKRKEGEGVEKDKKTKTGEQNQTNGMEGKNKREKGKKINPEDNEFTKNAGSDLCYDTLFAKTNFPSHPLSSLKIWKREKKKKTKNPTADKKSWKPSSLTPPERGEGRRKIYKRTTIHLHVMIHDH